MRVPQALDTAVRTLAALLVLPAGVVLYSCGAIVVALLTRSHRQTHKVYVAFARLCMRIGGTDLRVYGSDHVEPRHGYVVVSNHESNWDSLCVVAALPDVIIRFIAKRQAMRIPVFGHALRLTGNVTVHRDRSPGDVHRIRETMETRDREVSMYFFAEGTRTRSGEMGRFKMGAFATAISYGLPILPVGIAGTRAIWPPNRVRVRKGRAVLEIGEPILVDGVALGEREKLRDQTEQVVTKLRARATQRLAG